MKTTYFYGDLARYTGKTMTIHGGLFYEIEILEGHLKGQLKVTQRAPRSKGGKHEPHSFSLQQVPRHPTAGGSRK